MFAALMDTLFLTGQAASLAGLLYGAVLCLGIKRIDRSHVMPWSMKAVALQA
jgi:hypothetical protein